MSLIVEEDLRYDGKNIIIPGYWRDTLLDILKKADDSNFKPNWSEADNQYFLILKNFMNRVCDFDAQNYN